MAMKRPTSTRAEMTRRVRSEAAACSTCSTSSSREPGLPGDVGEVDQTGARLPPSWPLRPVTWRVFAGHPGRSLPPDRDTRPSSPTDRPLRKSRIGLRRGRGSPRLRSGGPRGSVGGSALLGLALDRLLPGTGMNSRLLVGRVSTVLSRQALCSRSATSNLQQFGLLVAEEIVDLMDMAVGQVLQFLLAPADVVIGDLSMRASMSSLP